MSSNSIEKQEDRKRLFLVTTVPETIATILRHQPAFLNKHFDVSLVTSSGSGLENVLEEGLPTHLVQMERGIHPLKDLVSLLRMIALLHRLKPDIVHSYTPKAGLVAMLAAWICRTPLRVHTFTGLIWPTATGRRRHLLLMVDKLLCACATHVIPESLGVQKDLRAGLVTAKPLEVIGHGNIAGVDIEFFSRESAVLVCPNKSLRNILSISDRDFVFVFVGRINRDKGISELIDAFELLGNKSAHLIIVGEIDKTAPISKELIQRIEKNSRIHKLGFQQDVRPALFESDVLVLPSYREGFPNVLLQAGAMEMPVIASDISGCNEIIEPNLNGWLVSPRDAHALTRIMKEVIVTPRWRLQKIGLAARVRVVQRFERNAYWRLLMNYYKTLFETKQLVDRACE